MLIYIASYAAILLLCYIFAIFRRAPYCRIAADYFTLPRRHYAIIVAARHCCRHYLRCHIMLPLMLITLMPFAMPLPR